MFYASTHSPMEWCAPSAARSLSSPPSCLSSTPGAPPSPTADPVATPVVPTACKTLSGTFRCQLSRPIRATGATISIESTLDPGLQVCCCHSCKRGMKSHSLLSSVVLVIRQRRIDSPRTPFAHTSAPPSTEAIAASSSKVTSAALCAHADSVTPAAWWMKMPGPPANLQSV
jgi:hypothetical protein